MFDNPFSSSNMKRWNEVSAQIQNNMEQRRHEQSASGFFERLYSHIEDERNQLLDDEVLAIYYCKRSGQAVDLNKIGYFNPNLIALYGEDELGSFRILVHMESVELYVRRLKIKKEEPQTRQFWFDGFIIENEEQEEKMQEETK